MADEEILGLLQAGERAAFRGVPGQGIAPLERAILLARQTRDTGPAARASWLLGVCRNAMGLYGQALSGLSEACAVPEAPTEFRSLAAAAVGNMFRQLGRHSDGRDWDRAALEVAGASPEAQFDAWLGLASDSVGLRDSDQAFVALAQAESIQSGRSLWWRQRIRLDWVRAEVALLGDDVAGAALATDRALEGAESAGAPRHVAKSLLFAGVGAAQSGNVALACELLRRTATLAEGLGARPLVWPARAVLSALLAGSDPGDSGYCLETARQNIRIIADGLPASLATDWLVRPDVAAVLG